MSCEKNGAGDIDIAGDIDFVDSNNVDWDSTSNKIVSDTPVTPERSVCMVMDIVDSTCMRIEGDAPANEDTSRDMNSIVDDCMHFCVNENV